MNIVHFSLTPLAGAPITLVKLLRRYTKFNVRLVNLKDSGNFEYDLIWSRQKNEVLREVQKADIIHLHNYLDLDSSQFRPIDFRSLMKKGKRIIKQFHSSPDVVSRRMMKAQDNIVVPEIPSLVIAQFQERYYPKSRVVPNPVDLAEVIDDQTNGIVYSPTNASSAYFDRWNTKAKPEILDMIRRTGFKATVLTNQKHSKVIEAKQRAQIVVDELVTGSYHLSGLEGLMVGKPTLSYLDDRTRFVLSEVSGSNQCPFINVHFREAFVLIQRLMSDTELAKDIGYAGREWIETYWHPKDIIQRYIEVYNDLMEGKEIKRQESLKVEGRRSIFFGIEIPNLIWEAKRK